jgi:hypothetical protein
VGLMRFPGPLLGRGIWAMLSIKIRHPGPLGATKGSGPPAPPRTPHTRSPWPFYRFEKELHTGGTYD